VIAEAAAEWAGTRRVAAAGTRVRYREAGEGPPIVLVHGLGISADYWARNGSEIASRGYRVVAPDLPGFGRTSGGLRTTTIAGQAESLSEIVAALALGPAVFVGHSLSCQTVLELAAHHPQLVRGLVLAAPTGERRRGRQLGEAWGLLRDAFREPLALLPVVTLAYFRAGPRRFFRTWRAASRHEPLEAVGRVRAPGLILLGSRDPVVSTGYAEALRGALPEGTLEVIEGAAHAVHFGRPAAFNAAVVRFLQRLATVEREPARPTGAA
jgi:2-hydroxy-6-oxonona-2,4-dienedioate hydrolase